MRFCSASALRFLLTGLLSASGLVVAPLAVGAQEPVMVFFRCAPDEEGRLLEDEFLSSLRLSMDRYHLYVDEMVVALMDFRGPRAQARHFQERLLNHGARAGIWLDSSEPNDLTVGIFTFNRGRTTIRQLHANSPREPLRGLVQTTAEYLASYHLLGGSEDGGEGSVSPSTCPVCPAGDGERRGEGEAVLMGFISAGASGGAGEGSGPSLDGRFTAGIAVDLADRIRLLVGAGGAVGPSGQLDGGRLMSWALLGRIDIAFPFSLHRLEFGPLLGAEVGVRFMSIAPSDDARTGQKYRHAIWQQKTGLFAAFRLSDHVRVALSAGFWLSPIRAEVVEASTAAVIMQSRAAGWFVSSDWFFF